jgi:hypothetical protein
MKFVEPRHFADPDAAARKLVETPDRHVQAIKSAWE